MTVTAIDGTRRRQAGVVLVVLALTLGTVTGVPAAQAAAPTGSIVYVKDHNVWLMSADGVRHHQVTTDGSDSRRYRSPSQTADGRIFVVVNESRQGAVHQLDQGGNRLAEPFFPYQPPESESDTAAAIGISELRISPDGRTLAYVTPWLCNRLGSVDDCYRTRFVSSDGSSIPSHPNSLSRYWTPHWITNTRLLVGFQSIRIEYLDLGTSGPTQWWDDAFVVEMEPAFHAGTGRLAHRRETIVALDVTEGPPATVHPRCELHPTSGTLGKPSWSPAGDALVMEWWGAPEAGIWMTDIGDLQAGHCETIAPNFRQVVAGGTDPYWSAAPFDPPPAGGPGGPGGPGGAGAGFDGDPATTERIDPPDPTATAVAISRARFGPAATAASGYASRYASRHRQASHVVLSRDDTFPDSLAGSPLTADGPLLFTGSATLTAATRDEIARVLPADGRVYLLGGPSAISAQVEAALRGQGYAVVRLAGPSRVETSIAVADEVRRLYPGATQVSLARAYGTDANPTAGWADSVTGGGWAASRRVPVLVTATGQLHSAVAAWLRANPPAETILFGGASALSPQVAAAVPNPRRVAGDDRAHTAARISTELWAAPAAGARRFVVFNGYEPTGWAYGLAAGGLAADAGAPLLVTNTGNVPTHTRELVSSCGSAQVDLLIVGGVGVVSEQIRAELDALDPMPC